ncbi:hypothetical protein [Actinoallomurus acanthiterrae]
MKAISGLAIGSTAVGIGGLFLTNIAAIAIVLILAACWVLADAGRAERLALIIRAIHGAPSESISKEGAPAQVSPTTPPRAVDGHWRVLTNALRRDDRQA